MSKLAGLEGVGLRVGADEARPARLPVRRVPGRRRSSAPRCRCRCSGPSLRALARRRASCCPCRSRRRARGSRIRRHRFDEQVFERLEHLVDQLLRLDPGASGGAVPQRDLLVISPVGHIHLGSNEKGCPRFSRRVTLRVTSWRQRRQTSVTSGEQSQNPNADNRHCLQEFATFGKRMRTAATRVRRFPAFQPIADSRH